MEFIIGDDHYLEGQRGSLVRNFYKNGQKKAEGILIDGIKNGNWSEWYANGDKKYTDNLYPFFANLGT